jgi:DNA-binding transcriptional ArsR family regulator
MRALAHPARLTSIQHLLTVGPATATELGEVVGLTPSAMSYHLRALERAGLISTAPSRGDGRERVWQSNFADGWEVESFEDGSADTRAASKELMETILAMEEVEIRQWMARADQPGWLDTGWFNYTTILANQAELNELGQKITALLREYGTRERRESAPDDAVEMRASFRGYPLPPARGLAGGDVKS